MATYETIVYERVEEKIFRLTLNRPENSMRFRPSCSASSIACLTNSRRIATPAC